MGVRLNRCLHGPASLAAGEFTVETESHRAVLSCPLCGEHFELPAHCQIEPDGRVVPAIRCRAVGCAFFDFVTLSDIWSDP